MNKNLHRTSILAFALTVLVTAGYAEITKTINYQGFLIDKTTLQPIDAPKDMKFVLCDSGGASCAAPLFSETRCNLNVSKGRFDVEIGSATAGGIPASVFQSNTAVWLERQVDADDDCAGSFEALSPRMRVQAAGYAFKALYTDTSTITMDVATATLSGTYHFTNNRSSFVAHTYDAGVFSFTDEGLSRTQEIVHPAAWPLFFKAPTTGAGIEGSSVTITAGDGNNGGGASAFNGGHVWINAGNGDTSPGGNIILTPGTGSAHGGVVIGTTDPGTYKTLIREDGSAAVELLKLDNQNNNTDASSKWLTLKHARTANPNTSTMLEVIDGNDASQAWIKGGGNSFFNGSVGISTTTPQTTFEVDGSASFGLDAVKSTFTATAELWMGAGAGLASRTRAQLEAATPSRVGLLYYCSDCLNSVNSVISTGTAVSQFATTGNGAIMWH
jgi:hypothetical protein